MLLQAGHGRGAVVQDQYDVAARRRIVDHLHQARDAAVDERAVANHADDAAGLAGGQGVASPRPMPMLAPMQTSESIASQGGSAPSE